MQWFRHMYVREPQRRQDAEHSGMWAKRKIAMTKKEKHLRLLSLFHYVVLNSAEREKPPPYVGGYRVCSALLIPMDRGALPFPASSELHSQRFCRVRS